MATIKKRLLFFLSFFVLAFLVMLSSQFYTQKKRQKTIIVGAKDITGQIVGEMVVQLAHAKTSIPFKTMFHLGDTFTCFSALNSKSIDLYVEYTGTALTGILKKAPSEGNLNDLREIFHHRFDLTWIDPLGFDSAYVIVTDSRFAEANQLSTLSDLAAFVHQNREVKIAVDPEFYARPERKLLEKKYGLPLGDPKFLEHELLYLALENHSIDVMNGYAMDGGIFDQNLKILEDDREAFPVYEASFIVRNDVLKTFPELQAILEQLSGRISLEKMSKMNYEVEKKGKSVHNVAHNFLTREGLLSLSD